ncbi:MAG: PIN domain-containing protein [Planctomycetota bacterium]
MTRAAYIDTSCIVAVLFGERGGTAVRRALDRLDSVFASNLLEAELRAAIAREQVEPEAIEPALDAMRWVFPSRSLAPEFRRVLAAGYARGADLWHLACALFLQEALQPMPFLTLDRKQRALAQAVGLRTGPR